MAVLITTGIRWLLRSGASSLTAIVRLLSVPGFWGRVGLCGLLIMLAPSPLHAQSKEYQIKAAFLFNFAQFVLWPATAYTNTTEPFQIGVLGDNPFGKALEETVRGETIQGRQILIVQSSHIEKLAGSQILFISKSEVAHFNEVFSKLDSKPTLTVSEDPGFIQHGGVINFYRDGTKIRFEINPDVAGKNGLKVGSELLTVGKISRPEAAQK
jgi:hypothetical protein